VVNQIGTRWRSTTGLSIDLLRASSEAGDEFYRRRISEEDGRQRFTSDDDCVTFDLGARKPIRSAANGVVLGIRPEHIKLLPEQMGPVMFKSSGRAFGFQTMVMAGPVVRRLRTADRMESLRYGTR